MHIISFGHAGDGNIHFNILNGRENPSERERAARAVTEVLEAAVSLGGAITRGARHRPDEKGFPAYQPVAGGPGRQPPDQAGLRSPRHSQSREDLSRPIVSFMGPKTVYYPRFKHFKDALVCRLNCPSARRCRVFQDYAAVHGSELEERIAEYLAQRPGRFDRQFSLEVKSHMKEEMFMVVDEEGKTQLMKREEILKLAEKGGHFRHIYRISQDTFVRLRAKPGYRSRKDVADLAAAVEALLPGSGAPPEEARALSGLPGTVSGSVIYQKRAMLGYECLAPGFEARFSLPGASGHYLLLPPVADGDTARQARLSRELPGYAAEGPALSRATLPSGALWMTRAGGCVVAVAGKIPRERAEPILSSLAGGAAPFCGAPR